MKHPTRHILTTLAIAASVTFAGCGGPSSANIALRKQVQDLQTEIDSLKRAHEADAATIAALQQSKGSLPTLPQDRLNKLFTVHGLQLGRLTGGIDLDASKPGDEGFEVSVVPTDDDGQPLKAAGAFAIEAFDLANTASPSIGRWDVTIEQARAAWVGGGLQYTYSFKLPWQTVPAHADLTLKITFTDELTGRVFTQQKVVRVTPPPAPTTAPAGA